MPQSAAQLARGAALADAAYAQATHYARLPLSYEPPAYLRERTHDGPLVCNVSSLAARTVRSVLGIGEGVRVMTLSFGGYVGRARACVFPRSLTRSC